MNDSDQNILTLAITGRNDDYNPYFVNRLKYCLEFTAYSLEKTNISNFLRFSIADWGSAVPLREALKLNKSTSKIVDFYEISEEIAKQNSLEEDRYFSNAKAHNFGIKRANSKFIGWTSHDYIMNPVFIQNLFRLLNGETYHDLNLNNSFFVVPRMSLPEELFHNTPSFQYLSSWLTKCGELESDRGVKHGGGGGAYIASRETWNKLQGIDERYTKWGVLEYDVYSRASLICECFETARFGIWQYKLPRGKAETRDKNISKVNKKWFADEINTNNPKWALKDLSIERKINLNFNDDNLKKDINLKLVSKNINKEFSNYKALLFYLHKLFLTPVSLRFLYLKKNITDTALLLAILLEKKEFRQINVCGYDSIFLISFMSLFDHSKDISILDDLSSQISSKSNLTKDEISLVIGDLVFKRSIFFAEFLMKSGHLGNFKMLNGKFNEDIDFLFKNLCKEKNSNILIIKSHLVNEYSLEKLNDLIMKNNNIINFILFTEYSNLSSNIKDLSFHLTFKFSQIKNDNLILLKDKKVQFKKNLIIKRIIFFIFSNIMYYFYYFYRLIKNNLKKILRINL